MTRNCFFCQSYLVAFSAALMINLMALLLANPTSLVKALQE